MAHWQGAREHRGVAWIGAGIAALAAYGFVATLWRTATVAGRTPGFSPLMRLRRGRSAGSRTRADLEGSSIVCIDGLSRPPRTAANARGYRRVKRYGAEFQKHRTVLE